jgi:hypothetical protein
MLANQASPGWRRDQLAAADLTRQAQQLQALSKESQNETRRLASAVDTLNRDRDRLYARVTVVEQGLESVTGAIARQNSAPAPPQAATSAKPATMTEVLAPVQNQAAAPAVASVTTTAAPVTTAVAPVATVSARTDPAPKVDPTPKSDRPRAEAAAREPGPGAISPAPPAGSAASAAPAATPPAPATPLIVAKSLLAPPGPGAQKLIEPDVAKAEDPPRPDTAASPAKTLSDASDAVANVAVQRTEFAVDIGTASSIGGLRALWRGLTKSNPELAGLRPIIMVKESTTGLGMQLRLAAGPLTDAAAAAKICAALIDSERTCEMTVFDGQRLAMTADEQTLAAVKPTATPPLQHRRGSVSRRTKKDEAPPKPDPSTLSRLFGTKP